MYSSQCQLCTEGLWISLAPLIDLLFIVQLREGLALVWECYTCGYGDVANGESLVCWFFI